jgi:transketolase
MHTVSPLDADAVVAAARETGGIVTVEEHTINGGLGGAVAEACLEMGVVPRNFGRIGLRHGFTSIVGSQEFLRMKYGLDTQSIMRVAETVARGERATQKPEWLTSAI